jgi:hypothetical protein
LYNFSKYLATIFYSFKILGNLYYAITHSPEPLSEAYSYALSWNAANDRFTAAGCITKEESDEYARAISSHTASIEVSNAYARKYYQEVKCGSPHTLPSTCVDWVATSH